MTNITFLHAPFAANSLRIHVNAGYTQHIYMSGPGFQKNFMGSGDQYIADEIVGPGTYEIAHFYYNYNNPTRVPGTHIRNHTGNDGFRAAEFEDGGSGHVTDGTDCAVFFNELGPPPQP